jgi:hypothetical protein
LAGVGGAIVVIAVVVGFAVGSSSDRSSSPAASRATSAIQSRDLARVQGATAAATSAGTAVSDGFAHLQGVPTVAAVSAVIDPYLTALEGYQGVLAAAQLPTSVSGAARAAGLQVRRIVAFLQSLKGFNSVHLGRWINGYYLHTAELQSAISQLQFVLPDPGKA